MESDDEVAACVEAIEAHAAASLSLASKLKGLGRRRQAVSMVMDFHADSMRYQATYLREKVVPTLRGVEGTYEGREREPTALRADSSEVGQEDVSDTPAVSSEEDPPGAETPFGGRTATKTPVVFLEDDRTPEEEEEEEEDSLLLNERGLEERSRSVRSGPQVEPREWKKKEEKKAAPENNFSERSDREKVIADRKKYRYLLRELNGGGAPMSAEADEAMMPPSRGELDLSSSALGRSPRHGRESRMDRWQKQYSREGSCDEDQDDSMSTDLQATLPWKEWLIGLVRRRRAITPEELFIWDTMLAVAIFTYVCFYRPYRITFTYGPLKWYDWALEVIFYIDIAVCAQTAYLSGGYRVVTDSKLVFRHYLRGWFAADLVATIPWDRVVLTLFPARYHPKEPVLQLLALVSTCRVMRAPRILHRLTADWTMHTVKRAFIVYAAFTCLVAHVIACLFYLSPVLFYGSRLKPCDEQRLERCSWRVEHRVDEMPKAQQYLLSLFWSFTTMTTLGYGDIVPRLPAEMIVGIFAELIGAGAFALLVMHIQKLYDVIIQDQGLDVEQRNELTLYLDQMSVDPSIKRKILRYLSYEANLHRYSSFNDDDHRFSRLTAALKTELRIEIFSPILKRNEVFNEIPAELTRAMAQHIQSKPCSPGEWFIQPGSYGDCAFILLAGRACVADVQGTHFSTLRWSDPNNVVAISSLLDEEIRSSLNSITKDLYAEAVDHCSLAYIHRNVFREKVLPACPSGDKLLLEILAKQAGVDSDYRRQSQTVWVGGLPEKYCDQEFLTHHFSRFGRVAFVTCRVRASMVPKSWALVSFWEKEAARAAARKGFFDITLPDATELSLRVHLDENPTKSRALALFSMRQQQGAVDPNLSTRTSLHTPVGPHTPVAFKHFDNNNSYESQGGPTRVASDQFWSRTHNFFANHLAPNFARVWHFRKRPPSGNDPEHAYAPSEGGSFQSDHDADRSPA